MVFTIQWDANMRQKYEEIDISYVNKRPYCRMNSETGEVDYVQYESSNIEQQQYDEETGEPLNGKYKVRFQKARSFQIPKKYLRGTVCEEFEDAMIRERPIPTNTVNVSNMALQPKPKKQQYNRDDLIKMEGVKSDIISGCNKENYRMFLLPSLFFFNAFVAFLFILFEVILHFWAHRKNGLTMNKKYYYRSPLHVLTSQFCATCRSESDLEMKIFDMLNQQMRLASKSKTLKDVTKAIS